MIVALLMSLFATGDLQAQQIHRPQRIQEAPQVQVIGAKAIGAYLATPEGQINLYFCEDSIDTKIVGATRALMVFECLHEAIQDSKG